MTILNLPFLYKLSVEVGRGRGRECALVKDFTPVSIPTATASDAPIAIRLRSDDGKVEELRKWNGKLLRPAIEARGDIALSPVAFEHAISSKWSYLEARLPRPFDPDLFPRPGIRWGLAGPSPLTVDTLPVVEQRRGWTKGYTIMCSTQEKAFASAQARLMQNIVVIDGVIHLEAAEPTVVVMDDRDGARTNVTTRPADFPAYDQFRLDRADEVRAWIRHDGLVPTRMPWFEYSDGALERDDEWIIASWIVMNCKELGGEGHELAPDFVGCAVSGIRSRGKGVTAADAEFILDNIGPAIEQAALAGRRGVTGHWKDDWALERARYRWEMAKAAGRGLDTRAPKDPRDVEALSSPWD